MAQALELVHLQASFQPKPFYDSGYKKFIAYKSLLKIRQPSVSTFHTVTSFSISSFPSHSIETKGLPLTLSSKDAHERRKTGLSGPLLHDHKKPKPRPFPPQSYMSTTINMRKFILTITSIKSQKRQANKCKLSVRSWVGGNWNKKRLPRQATLTWEMLCLSQHLPHTLLWGWCHLCKIHNRKLRTVNWHL